MVDPASWTGVSSKKKEGGFISALKRASLIINSDPPPEVDRSPLQKALAEANDGDTAVLDRPSIDIDAAISSFEAGIEILDFVKSEPIVEAPYVPIKYEPTEAELKGFTIDELAEYVKIAEMVGVLPDDLKVAEFTAYLRTKSWPVFDLKTVVDFMDEKSANEGAIGMWGWRWVPLRDKDRISVNFGTPADRQRWAGGFGTTSRMVGEDRPASDFYSKNSNTQFESQVPKYNQVVPLHALKKVAEIEAEFTKHPIAFMVSDYAPAPEYPADPFLMAVIDNPNLASGHGRFVIDVWDEPNFGIEQMLKRGI